MAQLTRKQDMRRRFREAVFERDGYRCVVCGFQSRPELAEGELDAHHITPRETMTNGGYVTENGATLCSSDGKRGTGRNCHFLAEHVLNQVHHFGAEIWENPHGPFYKYTPKALYERIGSSLEKAHEASTYLR